MQKQSNVVSSFPNTLLSHPPFLSAHHSEERTRERDILLSLTYSLAYSSDYSQPYTLPSTSSFVLPSLKRKKGMPMSLLDQPKYRRLRLTWQRNLRVFKRSFNLHPIRNLAIIFFVFFILSSVLSKIGHSTNTPKQRWDHLMTFATEPGTLGAPPEAEPDKIIHVQLCNVDGMCSSWDRDRIWMESELKRDESWLQPGWIRVHLGTRAIIITRSGRRLELGFGIHKCGDSSLPFNCKDIISLTVEGESREHIQIASLNASVRFSIL